MRARVAVPVIFAVLLILGTACPIPVTIVTPQGKAAYAAHELVLRIGELQNAAIDANARINPKTNQPALSTATTRRVVTFCVETTKTLKTLPSGWQSAVKQGLSGLHAVLTPEEKERLGLALEIVDVAIASLAQTAGGAS